MKLKIIKLAIPNVISNITIPFVGIVDLALAGTLGSSALLGGVGFGTIIFTLLYSGLGFLRMSTTGLTAQSYGAKDNKQASAILVRVITLSVFLGLLLIVCRSQIERLLFINIDGTQEALKYGAEYFRVRIFAAPATLTVFAFMGWFIGMQNTRIPMIITLIISISNMTFSGIFVLYLDLGIYGIALGTVIAQIIGLCFCIILLIRNFKRNLKIIRIQEILNVSAYKRFFNISGDIFIRSILLTGSFYLFNLLSAQLGDQILALNSIILQFIWFFSWVMDGFAYASGTLTGKFIGAKDKNSLKIVISDSLKLSILISLLFSAIYILFSESIIKLLSKDIEIIALSKQYLYWIWLIPTISFAAYIYDEIYIGATATRPMRNIMIVNILFIFTPLLFIMRHYFGNQGMWFALSIMFLFRGIGLKLFVNSCIINKL